MERYLREKFFFSFPFLSDSVLPTVMVQLTKEQRVWVCTEMARIDNAHQVRRSWADQWPGVPAPAVKNILANYRKYKEHGTSLNRNKENSGRPRVIRSADNINRVRRSLQRNGKTSARRNGLGICKSSFSRIVRQDIKFHPYVLVKQETLLPRDPALRLEFCHWFTQKCKEDQAFLSNIVTSDEAVFSLNSEVNTHNVINYGPYGQGHPNDHYIERQQGARQVMVWIGLTGEGRILGPHFVNGSLNSREYLRIIRYSVVQREFAALDINPENVWWQQDEAPAHTSNQRMQYLRCRFPGKVISKRYYLLLILSFKVG